MAVVADKFHLKGCSVAMHQHGCAHVAAHRPVLLKQRAAYYATVMTTISLKLPENLLARLERESRARRTTKSSVVRECLTETI